jgi:hypothetical protein
VEESQEKGTEKAPGTTLTPEPRGDAPEWQTSPGGGAYPVLASARYGLLFAILMLLAMLVAAIFMMTRGGG